MLEMKCPESCEGCYQEQTCELWKSTPLREDIEAEKVEEVRIHERRESLTGTVIAAVKPLYDYDCD